MNIGGRIGIYKDAGNLALKDYMDLYLTGLD